MKHRVISLGLLLALLLACNLPTSEGEEQPQPTSMPSTAQWTAPRTASEWVTNPVRGAVIEIGYGGPYEYNDPPYPTLQSLEQLRDLGVRIVELEFQYAWSIFPPYEPDEEQFQLLTAALNNVTAAGLYVVLSVRNGPGRNAMMPGIEDDDVITILFEDDEAQAAYKDMLRDIVERFENHDEIIAWEPIVEPALDHFLTAEEDPPYPQASEIWNELAGQFIEVIREVDPERPILIEPVNWGGLDSFELFEHFDDDNIIYSLHTYEPHAYTHQTTSPYGGYPGDFYDEFFDRDLLDEMLEPVDAFQAQNYVPIVVGEWGGIRWLPGIEEYIADQLSLFEERGWSWFWYAWDDEEWDELGFELHMGPDRDDPILNLDTPAFAPILAAWQREPIGTQLQTDTVFSFAHETRQDGARRLTDLDGDINAQNPAFSPSGEMILFSMFHKGYNAGPAGLYLVSLMDGEITTLLFEDGQDSVNLPGSSWNGVTNRITFASDRQETDEIWTIAPDGTEPFRVTNHQTPGYYLEPSFSPDGGWIVFEADEDVPDELQENKIWKVRADGSNLTQLTDDIYDDRQPNWSPTGDWILFQRRTPRRDDWNIYIVAPDGSDVHQVTFNPQSADTDISWSPNGTCIVYSTDNGELPVPNIFVIPVEGGEPVRITFSDRHEDGAPSWSPNGRWIAFESHIGQDEDSPSSIWIIAVPAGLCE